LTNLYNPEPGAEDKKATILLGELGIIPNKLMLSLAFRNATTGIPGDTKDNATTFGARYQYAQNIALRLEYTKAKKDLNGSGRFDGTLTNGGEPATVIGGGDTRTALILSTVF
jgi:hypothetical protein